MFSTDHSLRSIQRKTTYDMRVVKVQPTQVDIRLRTPFMMSVGPICSSTLTQVTVEVEGMDGRRAVGRGMIFLSDQWAWPSVLSHEVRDNAMRALVEHIAAQAPRLLEGWGHPVEFGCALHEALPALMAAVSTQLGLLEEPITPLAASVCASPLDAALHDAYGILHGQSSYDLLGPDYLPGDLSRFLGPIGAGATLDRAALCDVQPRVEGCVLVSSADALRPADVRKPVGDGLPDCIEDWVLRHGYTAAKLKLTGSDPRSDAVRTCDVMRVLRDAHDRLGSGAEPWVTVDPNEGYHEVDGIVEFLRLIQEMAPRTYDMLRYIEQPIPRAQGLTSDLRAVHALKPVFADESIAWIDQLDDLVRAGWSGVALKVCKSHTLCLLLAAWSHLTHHPYVLQDLGNASLAAVHSMGLAARLRTLNGIEMNSIQFTPLANLPAATFHPGVFHPQHGEHDASTIVGPGLGFGKAPSLGTTLTA
ncbi:MAG: enolase C-terminal domain-like protein [Armatimonadota bacterium]